MERHQGSLPADTVDSKRKIDGDTLSAAIAATAAARVLILSEQSHAPGRDGSRSLQSMLQAMIPLVYGSSVTSLRSALVSAHYRQEHPAEASSAFADGNARGIPVGSVVCTSARFFPALPTRACDDTSVQAQSDDSVHTPERGLARGIEPIGRESSVCF